MEAAEAVEGVEAAGVVGAAEAKNNKKSNVIPSVVAVHIYQIWVNNWPSFENQSSINYVMGVYEYE